MVCLRDETASRAGAFKQISATLSTYAAKNACQAFPGIFVGDSSEPAGWSGPTRFAQFRFASLPRATDWGVIERSPANVPCSHLAKGAPIHCFQISGFYFPSRNALQMQFRSANSHQIAHRADLPEVPERLSARHLSGTLVRQSESESIQLDPTASVRSPLCARKIAG